MTYTWPFPDGTPISQPFGSNPSNGFNPVGGHTGTDFAVPTGTPVMAIGTGAVMGVGQLPEPYTSNPWWIEGQWAGNVIVIDHGPVLSVYAHLSEWHVNLGDTVTQGQVIGLSGATGGASTGPHCHFETIPDGWDFNNGTYGRVNPNTYCTAYWAGTQEDELSAEQFETIVKEIQASRTVNQQIEDVTRALIQQVSARLDRGIQISRTQAEDIVAATTARVNDYTGKQTAAASVPAAVVDVNTLAAQLAPLLNASLGEQFITALRAQINK